MANLTGELASGLPAGEYEAVPKIGTMGTRSMPCRGRQAGIEWGEMVEAPRETDTTRLRIIVAEV